MEDMEIVELFWQREESAVSQVEKLYGNYCAGIVRSILPSDQDVEEVLSDTWLRAWKSIPPQRPRYLRLYLARIARNLALDRYRSQNRQRRGGTEMELALEELSHCVPASNGVEETVAAEELRRCIQLFLESLSHRERSIFVRRYFYVENAETIAAHFHMREGNVRTILTRTRKKLKQYLQKEGYDL